MKPKNLTCDATSQTNIEVNFIQISSSRWNGMPIGYKVFWKSLLQLEDKETFEVESFNSTSINVNNAEDGSVSYTIIVMDLEIFTNYSIIVGAYNSEGVGRLARVYCRTHEGGSLIILMITGTCRGGRSIKATCLSVILTRARPQIQ